MPASAASGPSQAPDSPSFEPRVSTNSGLVRRRRLGFPAEDVAASRSGFGGGLDDLHVTQNDSVEHRPGVEHRADPPKYRDPALEYLAVVSQQRLAVLVLENELVACVVEGGRSDG